MRRLDRSARWLWLALALVAGCSRSSTQTVTQIKPGPDVQRQVQKALISAKPGDSIHFTSGKFDFTATLSLDVEGVTIRGEGPDKTVLSFQNQGQGTGGEGLLVTKGRFLIADLAVEDAKGDAIKVQDAKGVTFRKVRVEWTGGPQTTNGAYGLYPVLCSDVLIEDCEVRGASDAGIYVGQSQNIVVRRNKAAQNVAGIEIENSIDADVYENETTDNAGGILVFTLPDLDKKEGRNCRVFKNRVAANNHVNFAAKGNIVAQVPSGTGIMIMANDQVEVFENQLEDNQTTNLAVVSYMVVQKPFTDAKYDAYPEAIHIHHNTFVGGGDKPAGILGMLKVVLGNRMPDILFDGAVDPAKVVNGALPEPLRLYIHDNGDADFANLGNIDLENLKLADVLTGKLKITRDLAPHAGSLPSLPAVTLSAVTLAGGK